MISKLYRLRSEQKRKDKKNSSSQVQIEFGEKRKVGDQKKNNKVGMGVNNMIKDINNNKNKKKSGFYVGNNEKFNEGCFDFNDGLKLMILNAAGKVFKHRNSHLDVRRNNNLIDFSDIGGDINNNNDNLLKKIDMRNDNNHKEEKIKSFHENNINNDNSSENIFNYSKKKIEINDESNFNFYHKEENTNNIRNVNNINNFNNELTNLKENTLNNNAQNTLNINNNNEQNCEILDTQKKLDFSFNREILDTISIKINTTKALDLKFERQDNKSYFYSKKNKCKDEKNHENQIALNINNQILKEEKNCVSSVYNNIDLNTESLKDNNNKLELNEINEFSKRIFKNQRKLKKAKYNCRKNKQ